MSQPYPNKAEESTDTIVYGTTTDIKVDTQTAYLGHALNYWRFNVKEGLDLTRNGNPQDSFKFMGTDKDGAKTVPVKLDKKKTAILVVDMQNVLLHPSLRSYPEGLEATRQVEKVITASHAAGVQVIYLNWAMTRSELKKLPPSTIYGYGRESLVSGQGQPRGPGYPKGNVTLPNGQVIDAGDMYIQGTWNAELYDPLMKLYKRGKDKATKPDVILRTHWMAMGKELEAFLEAEGLTTLLFAGLNIQQAVWATMCEARGKGYDTIVLDDCCAAPGDIEGKARSVILDNCKTFGGLILTSDEFVAAAGMSQA